MDVHIFTSLSDLDALCPAWEKLEKNAFLPMQDFIWSRACARSFASEGQLRIVVLQEGTQTLAIFPLCYSTSKTRLEWLGAEEISEPMAFLCADNLDVPALPNALSALRIPFYLKRLFTDLPPSSGLNKALSKRGLLISRPERGWPCIELGSPWEEPERQLNAGRRSDLRRARRIAESWGPVSVEIHTPTPTTLAPLLDEAFQVETRSWKRHAKTAMALDPLRGPFYRHYAAAASAKGILRLCFLRIGDQAAAMQLAVESKGRFWLLKIGYDERFKRCSPGMLLLHDVIKNLAQRGLHSLEFLGTAEPWIRVWTSTERSCVTWKGYPLALRGMSWLAGDLLKSAWHKIERVRAIPAYDL